MKILAINGSYRGSKGFTKIYLDKLFEGAQKAGAVCEIVNLSKMEINACTDCQVCHTEGHYLRCIYDEKDDVQMIFKKIRESDLIIYATPVYIFTMSSLLKKLLDRLHSTGDPTKLTLSQHGLFFHQFDHSICSKPFVALVCCDNIEDETPKNVVDYFKTFARFMDAQQVGLIVRKLGGLVGHGKDPEKEKKFPKIFVVYKALYDAGFELATLGRITKATQKRASMSIVPIPPVVRFLMRFKVIKKRALGTIQRGWV